MTNEKKKSSLRFVNFTKLDKFQLLKILDMRNQDNIREKMSCSDKITPEQHLSFCRKLKSDTANLYMQVLYNDKFVGVMDLQNIDFEKHTYEPGSYFVCEDNQIIASHASAACCYICLELKLYFPNIFIKKDNVQALLFNTMKLGNYIVSEDEEYYYLTNNFLNLNIRTLDDIYSDLSYLTDLYNLEFDI